MWRLSKRNKLWLLIPFSVQSKKNSILSHQRNRKKCTEKSNYFLLWNVCIWIICPEAKRRHSNCWTVAGYWVRWNACGNGHECYFISYWDKLCQQEQHHYVRIKNSAIARNLLRLLFDFIILTIRFYVAHKIRATHVRLYDGINLICDLHVPSDFCKFHMPLMWLTWNSFFFSSRWHIECGGQLLWCSHQNSKICNLIGFDFAEEKKYVSANLCDYYWKNKFIFFSQSSKRRSVDAK